jgi:hypothetical protein
MPPGLSAPTSACEGRCARGGDEIDCGRLSETARAPPCIYRRAIARIDAWTRRCDAVPYPNHGAVLRRFNRCGTRERGKLPLRAHDARDVTP